MERENERRADALDRFWDAVVAGKTPNRSAEIDDIARAVTAHLGQPGTPEDSAARERTRQRVLAHTKAMETSMIIPPDLPPAILPSPHMTLPRRGWRLSTMAVTQTVAVALLLLTLVTALVASGLWQPTSQGTRLPHLEAPAPQVLPAASPTANPQATAAPAEFVNEIAIDAQAMSALRGVAVGGDGTLYVIDAFQDHILRFDGDGQPLGTWGETGTGPGQFRFHEGGAGLGDLAIGPTGNVYVADPFNNRIQALSPDGTFVQEWGAYGSAEGQFAEPEGITVDGTGLVYVADTDNGRVQVFDPDGRFLASWVPAASEDGSRPLPGDVTVDTAGLVSVTDARTRQVIQFDGDGTLVGTFGGDDSGRNALVLPAGIAGDAQGTVFVADEGGSRVQVFAADGSLLGTIGSAGVGPGQFITPANLALGPDDLLYVSDGGNRRVQVFRLRP